MTEPIVLIDARNVLRSQWPNIPEDELVELARRWTEDHNRDALVIFDGRAPGGLVGEREEEKGLTVVGTGGESADDWIIRRAAGYAAEGQPYWVVTSDRALREAAGGAAERTVGGGSFSRELTALR